MGYQIKGFCAGSLVAAASMANHQFKCMKITAANTFNICDTDGEPVDGVLQDNPASGLAGELMMSGITKIKCGEALTPGWHWGTDASGLAVRKEDTVTGADVGDYIGGRVIIGTSAANELATVTIGLSTFRVEAQ